MQQWKGAGVGEKSGSTVSKACGTCVWSSQNSGRNHSTALAPRHVMPCRAAAAAAILTVLDRRLSGVDI